MDLVHNDGLYPSGSWCTMSSSISYFLSQKATPKIALLGAHGQLGRCFIAHGLANLVALSRDDADLTQPQKLAEKLEALAPDLVINCGAYNLVDKAETDCGPCADVNTLGVMHLAQICKKIGATLVTYSTDHVFGGPPKWDTPETPIPWRETDCPQPISVYGASKTAGEYLALACWEKSYVIRTCGLYGIPGPGGKGGNFVEAILRAVAQGKPLRVVADQVCTPTSVISLVGATLELLQHFGPGLYHLTDQGFCTWHEFAQWIVKEAGLAVEVSPLNSADWPAAAKRPNYSVLGSIHSANPLFPKLKPWRESLKDYMKQRLS